MMNEKPLESTPERSAAKKSSRRGFVQKLAYVSPFILSLQVSPAHATNGSGGGGGGNCNTGHRGKAYAKGRGKGRGKGHAKGHGHGL
jgi:hypothetical protein